MTDFYNAGPLAQIAINLFHGWGYNFYRQENQLRADDLLIRSKVGALLGMARKSLEEAQSEYRREFLPEPTREHPDLDPKALAGAQTIERFSREIGNLIGLISAQPVPENDRMTQRYRQEAAALQRLLEADLHLAGQAELLRTTLERKDGVWLLANQSTVREAVAAITDSLRQRQALLFPPT
jgi:hypothetical protein